MPPRLRGDSLGERVAHLGGSALFIQGPPGSGKTYTGRAADLRAAGATGSGSGSRRPAQGDHNLLDEVERAAAEAGVDFRGLKKSGGGNPESHYESAHVAASADTAAFPPGDEVTLIAGTPWLWAREELRGAVDVLFVDEAGQMSLADALAIARRRPQPRAARRPAAARARQPGHPPARLGRVGARAPARRPRRPCRRPRASSSSAPGACTPTSAASSRTRCTTAGSRPSTGAERQRVDSPGLSGRGRAHDRGRARRATARARPRRPSGSPRRSRAARRRPLHRRDRRGARR